jgi:hypothetical protein
LVVGPAGLHACGISTCWRMLRKLRWRKQKEFIKKNIFRLHDVVSAPEWKDLVDFSSICVQSRLVQPMLALVVHALAITSIRNGYHPVRSYKNTPAGKSYLGRMQIGTLQFELQPLGCPLLTHRQRTCDKTTESNWVRGTEDVLSQVRSYCSLKRDASQLQP